MFVVRNSADRFLSSKGGTATSDKFWRWGDDNMFPQALALLSRRSTTHRRILNDKANYISGKGFSFDQRSTVLRDIVESANGSGDSLRMLINKLAFDKSLFGNAFLEIVTDQKRSFVSLFHQDASKCRVAKTDRHVILHHDWAQFTPERAKQLPLYPDFDTSSDGLLRSIIHYKDYEPMFGNYGVPQYIAGMNVSAIAYKTDRWNISRLDNSFQLSGVMVLNGDVDNDADAEQIVNAARKRFEGKPGQVMFMIKSSEGGDDSKFIPISSSNEGDWKQLHEQATSDIVVAHSWFRSLSGLDYSSGFNSERILHEYEIALNTLILGQQQELIEPIKQAVEMITGGDCSSLQAINRPPTKAKPLYMKIWEARKNDGLDYDPAAADQNLYLAQITKYAMRNID